MRLPDNRILLAAAIPLVLGGTVLATFKPAGAATTAVQPAAAAGEAAFTLVTRQTGGRMAFVGRGGGIDGIENPALDVRPGQDVRVTIVNEDLMPHDFAIGGLPVQSKYVMPGSSETVAFKAGKEGRLQYYCTLMGHRLAGMQGDFTVGAGATVAVTAPSVSRDASDVPPSVGKRGPKHLRFDLTTVEVQGRLADGTSYGYWTFDGKVPGPMLRVREGDTVEVHLTNDGTSKFTHSIDLHAVTGPGGGAVATQTMPGMSNHFSFKALHPGLYVYHCATPMVAHHIANGMYGLILVEPAGGLPQVDREYYVMQGEIYTAEAHGSKGALSFSDTKLLDERPEYFVFNGAVGALSGAGAMQAKVGETIRIYFGDGGPNYTSSLHLIGETFDRAYPNASLETPPQRDVQSALTAAGGASIVEFKVDVPGRYTLVDHSLSRMERGLSAQLVVSGQGDASLFDGKITSMAGH